MFNRKEQEYELRMQHLKESMDKLAEKNKGMEKDLEKARARISELEEKLAQSELETLKREAQETLAEYKGLKELYLRKNQEFDGSMQTKEENYAKEEVHARRQFNDEIAQQKQDTEEYVSETVNTFSETYNYYLNQIKVLMDALGKVASATGKQLFSGEAVDLKTEFGCRMVNELKQETGMLPHEGGNRILFGAPEEEEEKKEKLKEEEADAEAPKDKPKKKEKTKEPKDEPKEEADAGESKDEPEEEAEAKEPKDEPEEEAKAEEPMDEPKEEDAQERMEEEWAAALEALEMEPKSKKKSMKKSGDKKKKKKKKKTKPDDKRKEL